MGGIVGSVSRAAVGAAVIIRIVPRLVTVSVTVWVPITVAVGVAVAVISIWISPAPAPTPAPPPRKAEAADEDRSIVERSIVETAEAIVTIIVAKKVEANVTIVECAHCAGIDRLPASRSHRSEIVAAATARSSCDY